MHLEQEPIIFAVGVAQMIRRLSGQESNKKQRGKQTMNKSPLTQLIEYGNSDVVRQECNYLIVEVEAGTNAPEVIVNPKENFAAKLEYYAKAYNDDLTLKANPNIKIIRWVFVDSLLDYFL
jgi:hypothetical protein